MNAIHIVVTLCRAVMMTSSKTTTTTTKQKYNNNKTNLQLMRCSLSPFKKQLSFSPGLLRNIGGEQGFLPLPLILLDTRSTQSKLCLFFYFFIFSCCQVTTQACHLNDLLFLPDLNKSIWRNRIDVWKGDDRRLSPCWEMKISNTRGSLSQSAFDLISLCASVRSILDFELWMIP